ncbi:hypothetical protein [Photorhabdus cinerea]|uniref:Uncharacterized protein n=1 Tax=Photorhabdus cinerea TaxID=471575 RepID=A0A7X5QAK5_9GAMM|nr:hypothetical protein [Photorhabdus cinerea]NHB90803.1 hypothetical protein [Photorhabdus cinerea]
MELNIFSKNIKSSGFILENKISSILSSNKWNVINNKYYIDDVAKIAREIDIIAYKAAKIEDIYVYTTLIISCKKNEDKIWALLTKDLNKNDPNIDLEPINNWSNHPIIKHQLTKNNFDKKSIPTGELYNKLFGTNKQIFAFQEMFKKNGKVDNDKNIFNSITSLMKSQSYEMDSLSKRKKDRCVYFFHLLSIIDSELVLLDFSSEDIRAKEVSSQVYISNYIINGESVSSKINFMTTNGFDKLIINYNQLHKHNCKYTKNCHKEFFNEAFKSFDKRKILTSELKIKYGIKLKSLIYKELKIYEKFEITDIWKHNNKIQVDIKTQSNKLIYDLNDNNEIKNEISNMIEDIFKIKIENSIYFNDDIPF